MVLFQFAKIKRNRLLSGYDPRANQLTPAQSEFLLAHCTRQPLISIVTPVYKVDVEWLDHCVRSVVEQHYTTWELILVDDGSDQPELTDSIQSWCEKDPRIKSVLLDRNRGIAGATNAGFEKASGEFIGILDHDDELTPDALVWVVWEHNQHPEAKWFYSDEDLITPKGVSHSPFFKPDYSPEQLLSRMFICHFRVYAADVLRQIGGKRTGFDGAQDHDLALRYAEAIRRDQIVHIQRVLYHWRTIATSAATHLKAKPKAAAAGERAVTEALQRRGISGSVTSHLLSPTLYRIELKSDDCPKAAVIISLRNGDASFKRCLQSIKAYTSYPNVEILIVHDGDKHNACVQSECSIPLRTITVERSVPHAGKLNAAAKAANADVLVFVDDAVEIVTLGWLDQLVATVQMDSSIAAAGGMLMTPAHKILHAGIVLGVGNGVGLACRNLDARLPGDNCRTLALQEYSALSGALLCVRRTAFAALDGFNKDTYPDTFSDIDLCLRLKAQGFRSVYNPLIQAIYRSGNLNESTQACSALDRLRQDHPKVFTHDPFFNPNLSLDNEWFLGYRNFPVEDQLPELKAAGLSEGDSDLNVKNKK